MKESTPAATQ